MNKQRRLNELAQEIIDKNICPKLKEKASQLVKGSGDPDADLVFIGEAPGKKEDQQGVPFVGAAGSFLDEMLASIKLTREDVYVTNIVKYRPENNRDPLPEEKKAFWPYLEAELAILNPKLIVTLGRHSMNAFLPSFKISQIHGQTKRINNRVIMPLYHPAAALYNGGMRTTLLDDFAKVPEALERIDRQRSKHI